MLISIFALLLVVLAGNAIYFRQNNVLYPILKPITTILIISLAIILNVEIDTSYGWTVIVGLSFALVGDIFLLKNKWFVYGLLAFLLAHIVFIYAFSLLFGFQDNLVILLTLFVIGFFYFRFLLPHLKSLAIPVAFYFLAIIMMGWQAVGLSISGNASIYYLLGLSSILFSFSDALIAYNKFVKKIKAAELLILSSYWVAIFIISASIAVV